MTTTGGEGWQGLVRPWWERVPASTPTVLCRDATASGDQCVEKVYISTECSTVTDEATGEPVKHCVKLYRRYLKCAGRPEKVAEQKQEMVARGEGAQQLEPNLVELPGSRAGPGQAVGGSSSSGGGGGEAGAGTQLEDVGHAFEEFLRFAEELQEEMVPGAMHLDQMPPAAARPYSEAEAQQSSSSQKQQQQQQQQHPGATAEQQPFGWLGGLLFGKRRAREQECGAGGSPRRRRVDASTWKEFEKDFTEV